MSPIKMSKPEAALRLVIDFNAAVNRRDIAALTALLSDDCVLESSTPAPDGAVYRGKAAVTGYWQALFDESANAQFEIEAVFGLGRHCVMRWRAEGLTGRSGHIRGMDVFRVQDGLISEQCSYVKGA